ncbi:hypothetical protein MIB92_00830 [Aestuariirhabdus sp. Z084]|uniref:hypothetical protein n=1 Tax=Aestuariirhabdus haliotis TaxID=2918751 RepID=UPI0020C18907|nr:hypothetical protein [Aestuariirhabdus haliotis]MCL6414181.1 hypothetical protein [Aestuariirhabdus haliotis]
MRRYRSRIAALLSTLLTLSLLTTPVSASGDLQVDSDRHKAGRMATEILVRPVSLGITILGTAAFVLTLPFSALGGNVGEAADELVVGPFDATFRRCLGCTNVEN